MKKKLLSLCLVLALALTAIGGTLAYFTDTDTENNVFTVGGVKIDLIEAQYHRTNASGADNGLSDPDAERYLGETGATNKDVGGNEWGGTYFTDEFIENAAATYKEAYFNDLAENMVPGRNIRKCPYVKNTGASDAYIRVRVLMPFSLFSVLDKGPSYWTTTAMTQNEVVSEAVDYYLANNSTLDPDTVVERDGVKYYEIDFTYVDPVPAGQMTFWNVWGNIRIDPNATSEDLKDVTTFNVIFEADAIQAEGFADYEEAFAAFDAE